MKKLLTIAFAFLFIVTFVGCRQADLHHNLEEIEADEILNVLHQNGIAAQKEREVTAQEISWKVTVEEVDVPRARQILIANNMPRRRELGLSGVYKEKGLIPTPDEQKARFLLALKGEIINSLQMIPGVIDADIVLNVPTDSQFADLEPVKKRPTASVVVKTRNDPLVAQTVTEAKIQQYVANAVPNLDPNDVTVIVSRADTGAAAVAIPGATGALPAPVVPAPIGYDGMPIPSDFGPGGVETVDVAGVRMDPSSIGRFKVYIIGLLTLLMGVSVFLLFSIMRLNRLRLRVQKGVRPEPGGRRVGLGAGGQATGLLGEGQQGHAAMEGTFDVETRNSRG